MLVTQSWQGCSLLWVEQSPAPPKLVQQGFKFVFYKYKNDQPPLVHNYVHNYAHYVKIVIIIFVIGFQYDFERCF